MSKVKSILGKFSPKRAFDAIVRRKVVSAIVAAAAAVFAAYGLDLTPEIQKALTDLLEAVSLAF